MSNKFLYGKWGGLLSGLVALLIVVFGGRDNPRETLLVAAVWLGRG